MSEQTSNLAASSLNGGPADMEVTLGDVLALLQRGWWVIATITLALVAVAILFLQVAERRYRSVLAVTPVSGSASLPSGLGNLASIAGIRAPGSDAEGRFDLFLEGLTTQETAERLVRANPELLPAMFPGEWDASTRQWRQPTGVVPGLVRSVKGLLGMNTGYEAPGQARVQRWLENTLTVSNERERRLTIISIETADVQFGRDLLAALHHVGDDLLRARSVERANDYVAYLTGKLSEVSVADYRQALVEALADQEKMRMMANSNLPFAAEPFGPPSTPDKPSSPNPPVLLAIAILLGLVIGTFVVLLRGRRILFPSGSATRLHE